MAQRSSALRTWALGLLSTLPLFALTDTTPPQLVSFTFTPTSVDVSSSAQTVVATAHITDDLSGFTFGSVTFRSPSGQTASGGFGRLSGSPLDGMYQANIVIPPFRQAGVWQATVQLQDAAGNGFAHPLTPAILAGLGFPTNLTVVDSSPDTKAPTLVGVTFSPSTIDVSAGDVDVTISLHITDDLSGVDFSVVPFFAVAMAPPAASSPTAVQYVWGQDLKLVSGTSLDGVWQIVKTIPRYSPAGAWQLQSVDLADAATNLIFLGPAQLAAAGVNPTLTVNSTPTDETPPALTGLAFSPPIINTSSGTQTVALTMSASDDLSGVDFTPTTPRAAFIHAEFVSPSGNQFVFVSPFIAPTVLAGTPLAGSWQMTATWPQFSEEGTWNLQFFSVEDRATNQGTFNPTMLAALGLPNSVIVTKPSLVPDGSVDSSGGTVDDATFGSRASVTFPPGVASGPTSVSIDVFSSPLSVPTPKGFTVPGTYFVNLSFSPAMPTPIPSPGITVVLPLLTPMTAGAHVSLYHIDPVTGTLAPAMNAFGSFVVGTVNSDTVSATFNNVVTLSTVVAYLSSGSVLGDVNGDGKVSCSDVSLLKASYGKHTGQAGFNLAADLNSDGVVDIRDLFIVSRQLPAGTTCP